MPDKVPIRSAEPGDGTAVARIRIAGWRWAYRGVVPDAFLDAMDPETEAARAEAAIADPGNPYCLMLAVPDGEISGYIVYTRPLLQSGSQAEVKALYVDPGAQRSGVGSALLAHAIEALRPEFQSLIIWCLEKNAIGRSFYEKHGGQLNNDAQSFVLAHRPRIELSEVSYAWDLAPQEPRRGACPNPASQTIIQNDTARHKGGKL